MSAASFATSKMMFVKQEPVGAARATQYCSRRLYSFLSAGLRSWWARAFGCQNSRVFIVGLAGSKCALIMMGFTRLYR